jgi:NitT/TauT family transport system permease protein
MISGGRVNDARATRFTGGRGLVSERTIWAAGTAAVVLSSWELAARAGLVDPSYSSAPSRIGAAAIRLAGDPSFWNDLRVSGLEFLVGLGLAIAAGIPIGLLAGWYRRFKSLIDPHLSALYATPRIALLPLVVLWFGLGLWSKIAIVFLGAFFPIAINVMSGIRTTDVRLLRVARSFAASEPRLFRTVILPSIVPFVLTGIRLAIGRALIGVIVGELYMSNAGIGHMIALAGTSLQTDVVFVGVLLVTLVGALSMEIVRQVENHFERWRPGRAP